MGRFDSVIDRNFSMLGEDAVYTPAGDLPRTIKVMHRRPDEIIGFGETSIVSGTAIFDIRVADITAPQQGDTLIFKGVTYYVQGEPQYQDGDRLLWRINTFPQ